MTDVLSRFGPPVLSAAIVLLLVRQCRKPASLPGRLFLWNMNARHASVTEWGLSHVAIGKSFTILDVGCGGGRTMRVLATAATDGVVHGVDYSATSVAASRSHNTDLIAAGQVHVELASVAQLPFADATFNLVTAVETHYYWPDPVANFEEIRRVLKPGGRLVIIAETFKGQQLGFFLTLPMKLLRARYLTVGEHEALFAAAGFSDVVVDTKSGRGWICVVGTKPATSPSGRT